MARVNARAGPSQTQRTRASRLRVEEEVREQEEEENNDDDDEEEEEEAAGVAMDVDDDADSVRTTLKRITFGQERYSLLGL